MTQLAIQDPSRIVQQLRDEVERDELIERERLAGIVQQLRDSVEAEEAAPVAEQQPIGRDFATSPKAPPVILVRNADGTTSSELTISVEEEGLNGGAITLIPRIWAGKKLSPKEAIRRAVSSGLTFPSFPSHEKADEFAEQRSRTGGAEVHGFLGKGALEAYGVTPPEAPPSPAQDRRQVAQQFLDSVEAEKDVGLATRLQPSPLERADYSAGTPLFPVDPFGQPPSPESTPEAQVRRPPPLAESIEASDLPGIAEAFVGLGESEASDYATEIAQYLPKQKRKALAKHIRETKAPKRGFAGKVGTAVARGTVRAGRSLGETTGASRLTEDQEDFRAKILGLRRQKDPLQRPEDPFYKRWPIQAAEMAPPMVAGVGAAALAAALSGPAAPVIAPLAASAFWYTQIYPDEKRAMKDTGLTDDGAKWAAVVSAIGQAALESLKVNPFKGPAKPIIQQTVGKAVRQYAKKAAINYGTELSEEALQALTSEGMKAVATRISEEAPDSDLAEIFTRAVDETVAAAGPLLLLMGPGTAVGLKNVQVGPSDAEVFTRAMPVAAQRLIEAADRAVAEKGPRGVPSKTDFEAEGLTGVKTRTERRAFIDELRKEMADAESVRDAEAGVPEPRVQPEGSKGTGGEGVRREAEARAGVPKAEAQKAETWKVKVGQRVRPADRRNLGTVLSVSEDGSQARVAFLNKKTGLRAVKTFPISQLKPASREAVPKAKLEKPFEEVDVVVPPPSGGPGLIAVDNVSRRVSRGASVVGSFLRRFLTSAGHLPESVFQNQVLRDAKINRRVRQAVFNLRDFDRAAKRACGGRGKMGAVETARVDAVLKNEAPLDSIPLEMRQVVAKMRTNIDALSEALIDVGAVEGKLVERIRKNLGVYVTRSYKVFDDPAWAEKVSIEVRNKAKAWLRSEYPDKTEGEIAALIESLLYEGKAADSPIAILQRGRFLGTKDLSILKKRKDIPIELRMLWGEHKDARINYSRSILKMAHLIENQRFLNRIRAEGLGRFFFEEPTIHEGEKYVVRIVAEPHSPLAPLDGLYTSLELKKAFARALLPADHGFFLRHYMRVNGIVKYAKTVGSLMTHIRNILGNTAFAMSQGHWRVWNANTAVRATMASLGVSTKPKFRKFFLRMVDLGVVAESARAGELQDVIRDSSKMDADQFLGANADKLARRVTMAATELYRAEDDVWKIFAFLHEEARYKKAHPEWSQKRIEQRAAKIVRNTYPTYSLIPELIKMLRRFPLAGTFVSFPAEVVRTSYKTLSIIKEELADPQTRSIAFTRMAGLTAAMTITAGMAAASRALTGTTKQHDEDKRHFMPPWSRQSQLLHLGGAADGTQRYIDLSYVDPYEYIKKPFTAFLRDGNWREKSWEAALEAAEPFLSEEILAQKLFDIQRNKKPSGGRVYQPEDEFLKQQMDKLAHVYDAIEPGTLSRARKFVRGLKGEVSPYGRKYDPKIEALAEFTGQRIVTLDIPQSLQFRARETSRRIRDAAILVNKVARRRGAVTKEEFLDAHRRSEDARREIIHEASEVFHAAVRLGVPVKDVEQEFRQSASRETLHEIITDSPLSNSWASNLLYKGTAPSASAQERAELRRGLKWLGVGTTRAFLLLGREYKWRNLKKGREVPASGSPPLRQRGRATGYALRKRRLVKLLLERP